MDIRKLRRLAREVDAEHQRAMHDLPSRRALLRGAGLSVLGGGLAVPLLARAAAGQEDSSTTAGVTTTVDSRGGSTTAAGVTTTAGATTTVRATTTAPDRPQADDVDFLVFAQGYELAIVEAYRLVLEGGVLSDEVADVARIFQRHHQEHAQANGGLAGKSATNLMNEAAAESFASQLSSARSQEDALAVALEMENSAASTYVAALADLIATDPAELAAAISPIEGRHAAVLGEALGLPLEEYVPEFQSTRDAATPAQFPPEEG